jgi:threonine synthase
VRGLRAGGDLVTVTDDQVRSAHAALARSGLYVEPTAAVCWAALCDPGLDLVPDADPDGPVRVVAPLCGSGLKAGPPEPGPPAPRAPAPGTGP